MKSLIRTCDTPGAARPPPRSPGQRQAHCQARLLPSVRGSLTPSLSPPHSVASLSARDRGCWTCETLVTPSMAANWSRRNLQRSWPRCRAGHRLRIGSGTGRVKGHVALDLLHDLVDVAIEHRDRAEAPQLLHQLHRHLPCPSPRAHRCVHSGMCAKSTIGVLEERAVRSAVTQASCSAPNEARLRP